MHTVDQDFSECFTCRTRFQSPLFCITRDREQIVFDVGDIPSASIQDAEGLEVYCSQSCLEARCKDVMTAQNCAITYPGIGPIEICGRCNEPFSTTNWHGAYVASGETLYGIIGTAFFVDVLARVCPKCAELASGADVDIGEAAQDQDLQQTGRAATSHAALELPRVYVEKAAFQSVQSTT